MAIPSTPTFRSLSQIVGDMVATFLSDLDSKGIVPGIQSLKPGSPYLAIFEAAGQSQFRNQEQTLSVLDANDLDIAHGDRLDRIGLAEKLPRRSATFASGLVNISDTSFTKITAKIYQGTPAPIPGSPIIFVTDASLFALTGNIYIGRGTINLEGPLAYVLTINLGSYWGIALAAPTSNFHGLGEVVTFAQGGDRAIPAGQVVQTPQGNQGTAAVYVTTSAATLLDGETLVSNVPVTSQVPGTTGNSSTNGVKIVASPAFAGMAVTNPAPITNGLDVENDDLYRERIKAARRARTGVGTTLGLSVYSYGVEAPDEAATVVSSQYVNRSLLPSLLVIDDGTGYEAKDAGVAFEVVLDSATGGEDIFFLNHGQPVAKASAVTTIAAPFALSDQATLTVVVGGVTYTHTFVTASFADITNASAYEVVASINANPVIPFSARTVGSGTYVAIFAKADVNDDIQVIATPSGIDANLVLDFPAGIIFSLRLYKNDVLLSKDGFPATLDSANQSLWSTTSSGETFIVSVDGTPYQTYTIVDADFIALGLGYTGVSSSLALSSWAAVFNNKVPGLSCAVSGASLVFTSNLGSSVRASIAIDPSSTLVVKGFFNPLVLTAQGRGRDYVLDRNRGQIDLTQALVAGDRLTAGTPYTRAYLQSSTLAGTITVPAGDDRLWFVVDGAAVAVSHLLNATHTVTEDYDSGHRAFYAFVGIAGPDAFPFVNIHVGDMAIWSDDPWGSAPTWLVGTTYAANDVVSLNGVGFISLQNVNLGHTPTTDWDIWWTPAAPQMMRVSSVDPLGHWFRCDYLTVTGGAFSIPSGVAPFQCLRFTRTTAVPQLVNVAANVYTQSTLADQFLLNGASAAIIGSKLRITTNTYETNGDIALAAQNINALALGFLVGSAIQNDQPENAAVESGNSEIGTGNLIDSLTVLSGGPGRYIGTEMSDDAAEGYINGGFWLRTPTTLLDTFWGNNVGDSVSWLDMNIGGQVLLDHQVAPAVPSTDLLAAVSRFRVGPLGVLNMTLDRDPVTKGFSIPMTRKLTVDSAVAYGQTIRLLDGDNANLSLGLAFGTDFNFANFVLHAHARARMNLSGQPGNTDIILVRLNSWTGRPLNARVIIQPPTFSSGVLTVRNNPPIGDVVVFLAAGAARAVTVTNGQNLHLQQSAPFTTSTLNSAFYLTAISRFGTTVTVQLARPNTDVSNSDLAGGNIVQVTTADANFPSGLKTIVSVSTTVFTNDTFTYTEAGAAVAGSVIGAWASKDSVPIDFSTVQVGDYMASPVTTYWGMSDAYDPFYRFRVTARDLSSPSYWVRLAATTIVTPGWQTIINSGEVQFFPLSGNTTSAVVGAINGAGGSVTAILVGGPGTGLITQVENVSVYAYFRDGILHIGSSTYNIGAGNYDLTLKLAPDASLTTIPNDWANEQFRLAPTTAKNVADYLNAGKVTGLASTGASIQTSSRAFKVQVASGTLGSSGAVQVAGGTANALFIPVLSAIAGGVVSIEASVETTPSLECISTHVQAMLNNSKVMPKVLDWTAATTLTAASGVVTVGGAGTAWNYTPLNPTFGTKYLFNRVGKYMYAIPTINAVNPTMPGGWVHFEPGFGKWNKGASRNTAVVGAAYVTLNDGRILSMGGSVSTFSTNTGTPTSVVEAYDPVTGTWSTLAPMPAARMFGAACKLANGKVLFTGGIGGGATWSAAAYIYDPVGDSWVTSANTMSFSRAQHTVSLMSNGKALIVGGSFGNATTVTASVDVYDPTLDTFTPTTPLNKARAGHYTFAFGLDNFLVIGGRGVAGAGYETYNINTTLWTNDSPLAAGETRIGQAVVQLDSTKFLVMGGSGAQASVDVATWSNYRTSCEIYDTSSNLATPVGSLKIGRAAFSAALLPNNKVVAWGGVGIAPSMAPAAAPLRSAEVFDIGTDTWSFASGSIYAHVFAPALLVSGSTVLVGEAIITGFAQITTDLFNASLLSAPAGNNGTFRVLNSVTDHLMFEAPAAADGDSDFGYVAFYSYNSVMPGDVLRIASSTLGTAPQGSFTVLGIDLFSKYVFSIDPSKSFASGAVGAQLPLVSIIERVPARMLYDVQAIMNDDFSTNQSLITLMPLKNIESFNANFGSTLTFEDKLNFPTTFTPGQDGYRYNTGLIQEVTKVIYGDESDSVTYPGYAAAGAAIDVSAPLIRRVIISLAVRARSGAVDINSRVQNAVAQVVNSAPPGPIAISLIVEEVMQVDGVTSVVMLSPVASTSADTIPVQPYEKALILDPANDVRISTIGP